MKQTAKVPYFDVTRQYQEIAAEIEKAITKVASSGQYILAPVVSEFESDFARYIGTDQALGVGSGTDALALSLRALEIGKGDEVIVPSFTFSATAFAVLHAGAKPVFADVKPDTYTLDPKSVESKINKKTRGIIPVHLYGQAADMDGISVLARTHKLKVIEDACQAHGATWKNKKAGSFGDAGCFSFYPTKNLGGIGDGGMITTSNKKLVEKVLRFRNLGRKNVSEPHYFAGWTSRLDAIQAAALQVKLKYLEDFTEGRRRAASVYFRNLQNTSLILPMEAANRRHVYHLFVVRVPNGKRDKLRAFLAENNVNTLVHYPIPVHKQPALKPYVPAGLKLKVTDQISKEILSLPMFPEITEDEVGTVTDLIKKFLSR